jgi:hypothetical protein
VNNRARRLRSSSHGLALCVVGAALAASCSSGPPVSSAALAAADSAHVLPSRLDQFCIRQQWTRTCRIPEYTDDQRLNNGVDQYGPKAFAVPAEDLERRGTQQMFVGVGAAVGGVDIDTTGSSLDLPPTYRKLNLAPGLNCIYLDFSLSSGWTGYIMPPDAASPKPCPDNPAVTNPLPVIATHHPRFPSDADVPGVIRFHEGSTGTVGTPQPGIGVKCAEKWCIILPGGAMPVRSAHHGMEPRKREWEVLGWSDAQHLAVFASGSTQPVYGKDMQASIVPDKGARLTSIEKFEGNWVKAATVVFSDDPRASKYETSWGFAEGRNQILIRKDGNLWSGRVKHHNGLSCLLGCTKDVIVKRHPHQTMPPATARFRWEEHDEGLWVRCADGCCKVSGT